MTPHRIRLAALAVALVLDLAALAALAAGADAAPIAALLPPLLGALGLPGSVEPGAGELAAALVLLLPVLLVATVDAAGVEWRRRDPSIPALSDDVIDPGALARRGGRRRRLTVEDDTRGPPPPSPGPGVQALALLVIAACSVASSGCGASALGIQADAAAVVGRVVAEADAVLIASRAADLDAHVAAAREECGPAGCDPARGAEILEAYGARERAWAPALACREPVVQGLRAWVDAIALARLAATEELGLGHALAELGRVLALWRGARACVLSATAAGGLALDLPDLPPWVYALAPGGAS